MCYKEQKVVDTLELQTFVIWLQKMIKHDIFYFTSLGSVHLLQQQSNSLLSPRLT